VALDIAIVETVDFVDSQHINWEVTIISPDEVCTALVVFERVRLLNEISSYQYRLSSSAKNAFMSFAPLTSVRKPWSV
jgi:hypothetical protein